ncbi:MAG: hypothetical protein JWO36_7359 [Myxococcales bacterium]|nr:hypothetical protein [Myxococcales bacterium]
MSFEVARAIADAVLLEGYALYPYRASAPKNRFRWSFGVLAPRAWSEAGGCEASWLEAQILVAGAPARITGQLRFFHIERRRVEDAEARSVSSLDGEGGLAVAWDEGIVQTIELDLDTAETCFELDAARSTEPHSMGRVLRERHAVSGRIVCRREPIAAERPLTRLTIRVENSTPCADPHAAREQAIADAFASTHLMVAVTGGELVSMIDPPPWAREAAAACKSTRTYPVLVGPPGSQDTMLLAPFILYDYPQLAPESAGDLCDATEIDELLMLRTQTLTDEEKRHARATDPRAAQIIDRADTLPSEWLARMHGAARDLLAGEMIARRRELAVGSKVRLRSQHGAGRVDPDPQSEPRRTDAQDLLYAGRVATIAEIRDDVDGTRFFAVTFDDDPAAELHDWYGRYHYYRTDEVEPL